MASSSRVLYIGVTNNLERRIMQHKEGQLDGFTRRYRCHRLVWFERFSWIGQAIAREKELKGWLRARKIELIQHSNPTWIDLSEEWGSKIQYLKTGKSRSFTTLRFVQDDSMVCHLIVILSATKDLLFPNLFPKQQSLHVRCTPCRAVAFNQRSRHARIAFRCLKLPWHACQEAL